MNGGTKGGQGGTIVTVDNAADFIYYVQGTKQTPYIIYVSGPIDLGGSSIRVRGHKTVIGLPGSRLTGNLKCYRSEESNNIFQLLRMDNLAGAGDGDCISIDNATNIWIDHCTFTDAGDGAVDIKNGADYVTVSWCKFQYTVNNGHSYVNLVGHSDTNGSADMGHLRVTFHHNWYSTLCHERMPSVRFGQAHVYNTYFNSPGNRYCIRTRLYAQCLVENNYFKDVQNPWERYVTSAGGDPGLLHASGNLFNNVTWYVGYDSSSVLIDGTETVFTPPYAYLLDPAEKIPALVQWGAGADGRDGCPPHWVFGTYGDFDYSGLVDMADYSQFSSYWLATTGIEDADYNENGLVDGEELALFVEHWMKLPTDETPPEKPANLWAQGNDGLVTLSWADHAEEDLAGYAIYRSTTSGSGYVKLNADPLTVPSMLITALLTGPCTIISYGRLMSGGMSRTIRSKPAPYRKQHVTSLFKRMPQGIAESTERLMFRVSTPVIQESAIWIRRMPSEAESTGAFMFVRPGPIPSYGDLPTARRTGRHDCWSMPSKWRQVSISRLPAHGKTGRPRQFTLRCRRGMRRFGWKPRPAAAVRISTISRCPGRDRKRVCVPDRELL
jgi:pectate lyase